MRSFIPTAALNWYHFAIAHISALLYGRPSRKLFVIGITGTKGKSTVSELLHRVLQTAGHKTALCSTIHFCIGEECEPNLFKMTMPGRGFLQQFLYRAVQAGCTHAVIEMTSEGAVQHRHAGVELDALVFTNLAPEHIESHGGMEKYAAAKLSLARHLERSRKRPRYVVANADDPYGAQFLETKVEKRAPFSLSMAEPYAADERSARFVWRRGELFSVPLAGLFNLKNVLAVVTLGEAMGIPLSTIKRSLEHAAPIAGRAEPVERGQPFAVVVDYAHTPDSLRALLETYQHRRIVCVMGAMGGGRDRWKWPELGRVAEEFADISIITTEDPYDEDPMIIAKGVAEGFVKKSPIILLDRRAAIREALREAKKGDVVLITGKGTDPYIMRAGGVKEPWSDLVVAGEELKKLGYH